MSTNDMNHEGSTDTHPDTPTLKRTLRDKWTPVESVEHDPLNQGKERWRVTVEREGGVSACFQPSDEWRIKHVTALGGDTETITFWVVKRGY